MEANYQPAQVLAGIALTAEKVKRKFDQLGGAGRVQEALGVFRTGYHLTSLSELFQTKPSFGPLLTDYLDPPTSGFSSDCYEVRNYLSV